MKLILKVMKNKDNENMKKKNYKQESLSKALKENIKKRKLQTMLRKKEKN